MSVLPLLFAAITATIVAPGAERFAWQGRMQDDLRFTEMVHGNPGTVRSGGNMTALPFAIFWVVLLAGRKELGWKGVLVFVAIWVALAFGLQALGLNRHFFTAAESLLDIVLIAAVYVGFTRSD